MEAIDEIKTFKNHPKNVDMFNEFVREAFKLLIWKTLLDENVIEDIKNLNYMTANMKIFAAYGGDILNKLDIR